DGVCDAAADDPVRAHRPLGRGADVHRAAFTTAVSARPAEDLREHPARLEAAREHVVMPTVSRGDLIAGVERGAYAHRGRLLTDRQMDDADESTSPVELGESLLEEPDPDHRSQPLRPPSLEEAASVRCWQAPPEASVTDASRGRRSRASLPP